MIAVRLCQSERRPPPPPASQVTIAPERLRPLGKVPKGVTAAEWTAQQVEEVGGTPAPGATLAQLKEQYWSLARAAAMTSAEREQEARRVAYLAERDRRKEATREREGQRAGVAEAQLWGMAWRRDLRSMMRYVAEHTRELRGKVNPDTGHEWTDVERGAEFCKLWRKGGVALILGRTNDETLKMLGHPLTDVPGPDSQRKTAWAPPGKGFVKAGTLAFEVLDSLICDPIWDPKFLYLTDGRMTFSNESFFHVLRKWGTKHSHFHRFYSIAMWCSVLSWNENVCRPILEYQWRRTKSGQLKSSAGRFYKVPIRAPQHHFWREEGWAAYRAWVVRRDGPATEPQTAEGWAAATTAAPVYSRMPGWLPGPGAFASYWLGWKDDSPPQRARVVMATVAAPQSEEPVEKMKADELRAELAHKGLSTDGKIAALRERVEASRADLDAVRAEEALSLDRRDLPRSSPRPSPPAAPPERRPAGRPRGGAERERPAGTIVRPLFGLPSPYKLPERQRQKRKPPPKGQPRYTQKRLAAAAEAIARGEQPEPIKRIRTEEQARAYAGGDAGPSDLEMRDAEHSDSEMGDGGEESEDL